MIQEAQQALGRAADLEPNFGLGVATKWYINFRAAMLQETPDFELQKNSMVEFEKITKRFPDDPDVVNLHGQVSIRIRISKSISSSSINMSFIFSYC